MFVFLFSFLLIPRASRIPIECCGALAESSDSEREEAAKLGVANCASRSLHVSFSSVRCVLGKLCCWFSHDKLIEINRTTHMQSLRYLFGFLITFFVVFIGRFACGRNQLFADDSLLWMVQRHTLLVLCFFFAWQQSILYAWMRESFISMKSSNRNGQFCKRLRLMITDYSKDYIYIDVILASRPKLTLIGMKY